MSVGSVHNSNEWSEKFFARMMRMIEADEPFTIVRYGDGELTCIMHAKKGGGGVNYDGDHYSPELGHMIQDSVMHPIVAENFFYALGEHCHQIGLVRDLVRDKKWNASLSFQDAFVFVHAGIDGRLQKLVDLCNERHSVFVGPEYLQKIPINFNERVVSLDHNSFAKKAEIIREIESHLVDAEKSIVICALGMSAIPILRELYQKFGLRHTFIDIGSVFDPYVENGMYRSHFAKIQTKLNFEYDKRNKRRSGQAFKEGSLPDDGGRTYNSNRRRKKARKRAMQKALQSDSDA